MTHERDIERLLDQWFADGPSEASDRVLDVVADRIGRQTQLPAWRVHRRINDMYRTIGAIAGIAAVIVIAFIGYNALGGQRSPAVGVPSTAPSAVPGASITPSVPPSPAATAQNRDGVQVSFNGTLPPGWEVGAGTTYQGTVHVALSFRPGTDPEAMVIEVLPDRLAMASDCSLGPERGVGASADAIVTALETRKALKVSQRTETTIGTLSGIQIDTTMAPGAVGSCATGDGRGIVPLVGYKAASDWLFSGVDENEVDRLLVLDRPGGRNVIVSLLARDPATFERYRSQAMTIVDGLTFDVGP